MVKKLLIGSGNSAKIEMYKKYLADLPIEIVSIKDLGIAQEPEEDGKTIQENAKLKALYYFKQSGLPTLADDAGFEIAALNNFPGVYARRFAGENPTDEQVIIAILEKMRNLSGDQRKARMIVALALTLDGESLHVATGEVSGHVPEQPYEKIRAHMPYRSLLYIDSMNKWFDDFLDDDNMGYRKAALEELKQYLK